MAKKLKPILESVDDLSTEIQQYYVPGTGANDGKYVLAVEPEGGYALENIAGLKKTAESEREARKEAEKRLKLFEGLDPDDARQAIQSRDDVGEDNEAKLKAAIDAERQRLVKEFEKREKSAVAPVTSELEKERKLRESFAKQLEQTLVADRLTAAAQKSGADPLLAKVFRDNIRTRVTDDGLMETVVVDDNGEELFDASTDGGTQPRSIESLFEKAKLDQRFERYFDADSPSPSSAAGGRNGTTRTGAPPTSGRTIRISFEESKDPATYQAAKARAKEVGGRLEITNPPARW